MANHASGSGLFPSGNTFHAGSTNSRGKRVGEPTRPTATRMEYRTDRYEAYNWESHRSLPARHPVFRMKHNVYDGFKLLTGNPPSNFTMDQTPCNSIRLDDKWVGLVNTHFDLGDLGMKWPSEFDTRNMLRATRVSLGDPCLIWINKGQLDIDGNPAPADGCYYGWCRGLQLLCGDHGLDEGLYWQRPSFEDQKCDGIAFKASHKAEGMEKEDALLRAEDVDGRVAMVVAMHGYTM